VAIGRADAVRSSHCQAAGAARYHLRVREPQKEPVPPPSALPADPLASAVARSVGELRRGAGLSERAAAKRLGTSQTQLRRMEDPRYLPSLRSLARVAAAYGHELQVSFRVRGSADPATEKPKRVLETRAARRGAPKARAAKAVSGSASPSKGRTAAPGRARAGSRSRPRPAAPRRRS